MKLRYYQEDCIEAALSADGNALCVLATGAGKSLVVAGLIERILALAPTFNILVLQHRKELVEQNARSAMQYLPELMAQIGIYSASVGIKQAGKRVTFAQIQSIHDKADVLPTINYCIIDECFLGDTLISTTKGKKRIDHMHCGDIVYNAIGFGVVEAISAKKTEESLVKIKFSNGSKIECTKNHPIFTNKGWIEAGKLEQGDFTFSEEGLRSLWERICSLEKRDKGNGKKGMEKAKMLLRLLCKEITEPNEQSSNKTKGKSKVKRDKTQTYKAWRERAIASLATISPTSCFGRGMGIGVSGAYKVTTQQWLSDLLQNRHSKSCEKDWNRNKRSFSRYNRKEVSRLKKSILACFPRVVNVSDIKSKSPRTVFNLQISGHPSYFANGKLVHNCHRINREDAGIYRNFINGLRARNPKMGICGLTATPFRTSTGIIMAGKDPLFPEITYEIGMRELIEKGYLSPLVSKFGAQQADLKKVGIRQGEYVLSDMENAISPLTQAACDEIVALGQSRKHWLLFTPGVKSAHEFAKALVERGVRAEALSGEMGKTEREAILARFARGETRALTNCDILTEGYDFQGLDLIAILRGTKSPGLFVQICGRGLRTREGKKDCLVLDYAGNLERFGAVDCIRVRKTKDGYKLATKPLKSCPQCGMAVPVTVRDCECGHVFERLAANHEAEASTRSVLSEIRELNVHWTTYKVHNKPGKPPSLKVIYECENKETIREFICFEHEGYAKKKACQWWRINQRADSGLPVTVQDAFFRAEKELKPVRKIKVQPDGKFWKVIAKEYGEREAVVTGSDELYESDGINI